MSQENIRAALDLHLTSMSPSLEIGGENTSYKPVPGTPYQRVNLLPAKPENPIVGDGFYRDLGIYQVSLCYPLNTGPNAAEKRAHLVKTKFKRATTLTSGGYTITIDQTPTIASGFVDGDRWVVPISIPYWANIFI